MRMNNEMRELLNSMSEAREKLKQAISTKNVEEAKKIKSELENLSELYDAAETSFMNERKSKMDDDSEDKNNPKSLEYNAKLFYKAISTPATLNEDERNVIAKATSEYRSKFSEATKENGGYTVPDDLSTEIYEKIKTKDSVRNLVSTENVTSTSGTRLYKTGEVNRLYNTEEYEEIKEMNTPNYGTIKYNQKKFAAILPISSELLEDSIVNFSNEITDWLSEAARVTENHQVLYGIGNEKNCQGLLSTVGAFKEVTAESTVTIDFLRKVKFSLPSGYRASSQWVMNTDAFLEISALKDNNGRSYIQDDPKVEEGYLLLGRPICIFDDIASEDNKTSIMFGDFQKAYRIFDRRNFGIAFTDIGAGAFETDTLRARGTERFDGKILDNNACVIVRDFGVASLDVTEATSDFGVEDGEISAESLAYQTKSNLLEIADEIGVAGVSNSNSKQEIIAAILNAIKMNKE